MQRRLLVSIHDVMPATLGSAERIIDELQCQGLYTVTLLVVPDTGWSADTLLRLRRLATNGAVLAGHGWRHSIDRVRGLYHRLHSALISRNVAEHLALDERGIAALIARCHDWFRQNDLPSPELYVPPAWAMGSVSRATLENLPFRDYETMTGVLDSQSGTFTRTAMIGFEADTAFRALSCRLWNRLNLSAAGTSKPLRVAIHPHDFDLLLADDLRRIVAEGGLAMAYSDLRSNTTKEG